MNEKTPAISVIVPVYKVEDYIRQCIESVLNQTFTDFELILVDDGSPDNCGKICDEYAEKDPRIIVIHQENRGVSAARNTGLDVMRGKYVTFVDGDDYISEDYLEVLHFAVSSEDFDMAMCGFYKDEEGELIGKNTCVCTIGNRVISGRELSCLRYKNKLDISAWAKLYRRELYSELKFPEGKIHEDQAVIPKIFYLADKVVLLEECYYYYRVRSDSISHSKFKINRFDNIVHMNEHIQFLRERNEKELYKMAVKHRDECLAMYTIQAKKNGISRVPKGCYMSEWVAFSILERVLPYDKFSWHLGSLHPKWVRPYEYLHKIKCILTGKSQ